MFRKSSIDDRIAWLHRYNEIKDVAQMLLGKLGNHVDHAGRVVFSIHNRALWFNVAELDGVRTRDVYPRFGLDVDD